jgi:hypothetical protein
MKIPTFAFGLLFVLFCIIAGCSSEKCLPAEDMNISVSVIQNDKIMRDSGLTYRHNVTINIANIRDTPATRVEVTSGYCDIVSLHPRCVNRTFSIPYIPPNGVITQYIEYDRNALEDALVGKYQLQYTTNSCLPYIVIDNKLYGCQR